MAVNEFSQKYMYTETVGQGRWALFYLPEHCYTLSESAMLATNMTRLMSLAVLLVLGVCGAVAMETTMSELKKELKALKETTEGLKLKLELSELRNIELQDRVTRLEKGKGMFFRNDRHQNKSCVRTCSK